MSNSAWALGFSLLLLVLSGSSLNQAIERKAYDWGVQLSHRDAGNKIAIVTIDDYCIQNIERWPWSRNVQAELLTKLKPAKVVGNTVFYIEPQLDTGLEVIQQANQWLGQSAIGDTHDVIALKTMLQKAQQRLYNDSQLAKSLAYANNVVLTMPFVIGSPQGNLDSPLPPYVVRSAIPNIIDASRATKEGRLPTPALAVNPPIEMIGVQAKAIGHLNSNPDIDGAIRVEPLVLKFYDQYFSSLALQVVANYLNLTAKDIKILPHCAGMGTTLVAGLFLDNQVIIAHIGDSRAYQLRDENLIQLTSDHSLLQEQLNAGLLSQAQAKDAHYKNYVTRALWVENSADTENHIYHVKTDDIYLLCSDGLTDMVDDDEIRLTLFEHSDNLELAANTLIRKANMYGGKDNISLILVHVLQVFAITKPNWYTSLFKRYF